MKYDLNEFNYAVKYYRNCFKSIKSKSVLIVFDINNKQAFYSIAPLSRALHNESCDVSCIGINGKSEALDALIDVWEVFDELERKIQNPKTNALNEFINEVDKKAGNKKGKFKGIFKRPECILYAKEKCFTNGFTDSSRNYQKNISSSSLELEYNAKWYKDYRMEELMQTSNILWKEVYSLKKGERAGIGFVLIPHQDLMGHPLEDYLDSYSIIWAMAQTASKSADVFMSAYTSRGSMLESGERVAELRATLLGCELDKSIDEDVFIKYKQLSNLLNLARIKPIDLTFFVGGKGYPGRHFFGEIIGYPSLNKKTRWQSPGQMVYKLDFYPQTIHETRDPIARVAFTETIPIDIFIDTNLINWTDLRTKNQRVKDIMDRCEVVYVKGNPNGNPKKNTKENTKEKYVTNLEVGLVKEGGSRRWVRRSDSDVMEKINKTYLKMTGIKSGCMGNIPGGEAFVTPEYMKGIFVGDVVVHVDQSYPLNKEYPLVVECYGDKYKIIEGPKEIIDKINKRKKEAMSLLLESEKNKSLPQEIIDLKKKNFERIGEFAINTNPKARLCEYLIVNEKIAKMMHIALGSGFEPDRSTDYHMDIVFNAPRQKLNVYGVDKKGKEHWILKDGDFVA